MPTISVFFESSWRKTRAIRSSFQTQSRLTTAERDERRCRERQHDPPEDAPRRAPVDHGGLDHAGRDRAEEVRQHVDGERQHQAHVDQDHEPEGGDLPDPHAEDEERHEQDDRRHHHQRDEHAEHDVAPPEVTSARNPRRRARRRAGSRRPSANERNDGVAEPARELVAERRRGSPRASDRRRVPRGAPGSSTWVLNAAVIIT